MIIKTVEVENDADDVLDDLSTADLIAELETRDDAPAQPNWDQLYTALATKQDGEALRLVRELVEQKTGRIVP